MKKQYESPEISIIQLTGGPMMYDVISAASEPGTPAGSRRRSTNTSSIWGDDEKQETSSPWN